MTATSTDELNYAGFWPRLGAILMDGLIMFPLIALILWGGTHYRLFQLYILVPGTLFGLFYSVYLVKRFGGTPGKLIVGIQIRKTTGEPVGYREAFLRYLPGLLLGTLLSIAAIVSASRMSDLEFQALSWSEQLARMDALSPFWYTPVHYLQNAWTWSELIVLLTNRKRRALHDFIAGTVVVRVSPNHLPNSTAPGAELESA